MESTIEYSGTGIHVTEIQGQALDLFPKPARQTAVWMDSCPGSQRPMSRTEALLQQNQELLDDLTRFGVQLRLGSDRNGSLLHRKLTQIVQKLEQHLHAEEREVYPELDRSKYYQVRQVSKSTHRGLEDLDHRITRFLARWSNVAGIDSAHRAFTHDATVLVQTLRRVLSDERSKLFPIMERRH